MATKAELERAYASYRNCCAAVARHVSARALPEAVRDAELALPLLHPALAYRRRYLKAEPAAPTLDALLRYAPQLFLAKALDAVEAWFAGGTRGERAALPDVPARLENARRVMLRAAELWSALAASPAARLRPDGRDPRDAEILATWLAAGAVACTSAAPAPEYARVSDPRRPARGKCGACGHLLTLPLARLLEPFPCPACRRPSHFVVVGRLP